jgi:DNA-binding CsgD family transcriptional regulator
MYDNVTLQNNTNVGSPPTNSYYEIGGGVSVRTAGDNQDRLTEFIMRGGVIQGNVNAMQNGMDTGGGIRCHGFGLFTMEGGVIKDNTAVAGGGIVVGSRATFRKTGGIIYGKDAPAGFRNVATIGYASPKIYGHAIYVALTSDLTGQIRDDTVAKNDNLSYFGRPSGDGFFGEGERWNSYTKVVRQRTLAIIFSILISLLAAIVCVGFFILKKNKQKRLVTETIPFNFNEATATLTNQEKKVFDLLLTDMSLKMISSNLGITYAGVTFHCTKIYDKLHVKNRKELLVKWGGRFL